MQNTKKLIFTLDENSQIDQWELTHNDKNEFVSLVHVKKFFSNRTSSILLDKDAKTLVLCNDGNKLEFLNVMNGIIENSLVCESKVNAMAFWYTEKKETFLIVGLKNGYIEIFNSSKRYKKFHSQGCEITNMLVDQEKHQLICGHASGEINVWDLETNGKICEYKTYEEDSPRNMSFVSKTKDWIAFISKKAIEFWNKETGETMFTNDIYDNSITRNFLISKDNICIASSEHGQVKGFVWDPEETISKKSNFTKSNWITRLLKKIGNFLLGLVKRFLFSDNKKSKQHENFDYAVNCMSFVNENQNLILLACRNGILLVMDVETKTIVKAMKNSHENSIVAITTQ